MATQVPTPVQWVAARRWRVVVAPWRRLGGAMLALAVVLPRLPHRPGLPCPLRAITGIPCPACGMTTSVEATCDGQLRAAVVANPFGPVAVAVAVALLIVRRWQVAAIPVVLIVAAGIGAWAWELHRFAWL